MNESNELWKKENAAGRMASQFPHDWTYTVPDPRGELEIAALVADIRRQANELAVLSNPDNPGPNQAAVWLHKCADRLAALFPSSMSLRDWFAGQALAGICASRMNSEMRAKYLSGTAEGQEAALAYALADAMFKARQDKL
jgi:hypothetical protein